MVLVDGIAEKGNGGKSGATLKGKGKGKGNSNATIKLGARQHEGHNERRGEERRNKM